MRIFLTGGSGFIGRHLLPLLDRHEVLCLSHSAPSTDTTDAPRTIRGDLNAPASMQTNSIDSGPSAAYTSH